MCKFSLLPCRELTHIIRHGGYFCVKKDQRASLLVYHLKSKEEQSVEDTIIMP